VTLIVDLPKQDCSTILSRDDEALKHQEQLARLGVDLHIGRVLIESVGGEPCFDLGCSGRVPAPAQRVEARLVFRFRG
jgi:hypothetical protein